MHKGEIFTRVEQDRGKLLDLSKQIWETPELGLQEHKSSQILSDTLEEEGFSVESGVCDMPTAFIASYGREGPNIGILGEYDALPNLSQKVIAKREPIEEGAAGHGCGHNLFGVGSLGGAIAIKRAIEQEELEGTIVYFGCPAEENADGKVFMAKQGVFDELDAALAWHPNTLSKPFWKRTLAMDSIQFSFKGTSAHAAAEPESGRSSLDAVQLMNTGVEYMREHIPDEARVHYTITNGGEAPNVVPAESTVWYYVRAPTRDGVDGVHDWIEDISKGAAKMTQTTVEKNTITGLSSYLPNRTVTHAIWENMNKAGSVEYTEEDQQFATDLQETLSEETLTAHIEDSPQTIQEDVRKQALYSAPIKASHEKGETLSGSTDVADVSWNTPTAQFMTASWPIGTPMHSWQAVAANGGFGRKSAIFAAKVIAGTAYDLLTTPSLLDDAWAEFNEATDDGSYESPLSADAKPPFHLTE